MHANKKIISKIISEDYFAPQIGDSFIQTFEPGCKIGPDQHDTVEVISVVSGSSYTIINDQYVKLRKNECLVLFPNVRHCFLLEKNQSCRLINIHFKQMDITSLFDISDLKHEIRFFYELKTNSMSHLKLADNSVIRNISERIVKEVLNSNEASDILLRLYFCEMYVQLSRAICWLFCLPCWRHLFCTFKYICFFNKGSFQMVYLSLGINRQYNSHGGSYP